MYQLYFHKLVLSKDELQIFLKNISGLGKKKVVRIFDTFAEDDIVDILEQEPFSFAEINTGAAK